MLLLITEGSRHAAAAGGNDMHGRTGNKSQQIGGKADAHERFLVAVPMEPDVGPDFAESIGADAAGAHFAHQEFIEQ